jgi:hypothetical protein
MHVYIIIASDRFQLSSWDYWDPFISKFLGTEPEISLIISNKSNTCLGTSLWAQGLGTHTNQKN